MNNNSLAFCELSKQHLGNLLKLKQKKFRLLEGTTLVEGANLIDQLVDNNLRPLELITSQTEIAEAFKKKGLDQIILAKPHEIEKLAETDSPQPLVGVYSIPSFQLERYQRLLYLDGIRDPGNLGALFRLAAAFDWDGIALSPDCCEAFSPKVVRASLGSVFWLPSFIADIDWMNAQTGMKLGLDRTAKVSLTEIKPKRNQALILVVGSEASGISEIVKQHLDNCIAIEISNRMESLNAAVATGIAVYELSRLF